jgi:hypothetical protein
MKLYTFDQFKQIQGNQQYKYVGLFNQQGQALVPYNNNKQTSADRLREIETRLMSEAMTDSFYYIKCKNTVYKHVPPDSFAITKKEQLNENSSVAPIQIIEKPVFQPEVLSYEGALKLQVEVERLKMENLHLKREVGQLKQEIEDNKLLSEEEEETPSLMDNAKSWLEEIMSIGAPLLDKHFQLKERQLELRAYELKMLQANKPATPMQKPETSIRPEQNHHSIENIIMTFKENSEVYNKLAEFYNNAQNVEEFLHNVKMFDENIYNQFAQ